jgi:hypothetical protein
VQVGGGLLREQHPHWRAGEAAQLTREGVGVAVREPDHDAGAGRLGRSAGQGLEPRAVGQPDREGDGDVRESGHGVGHGGRIGAGLGLDLPVHGRGGDGPLGHRRPGGSEEGADRRQKGHGHGDASGCGEQPAPATGDHRS